MLNLWHTNAREITFPSPRESHFVVALGDCCVAKKCLAGRGALRRCVRTLRASVGCGMILGESTRRRAIPRADLLSQNLDQQVTARLATT